MTRNGQNLTKLIAIIALCFSTITNVFASEVKLRPENFTHLTIEDGLPQNNVRCIEEDQYGFLWFCTSDGLVRYDGYEFELVTEGVDGSRISNTIIRAILADKNNLWIGTDNGINQFKLKEGVFVKHELFGMSPYVNKVISIESSGKDIFVGTGNGLFKINKSTGYKEKIKLPTSFKYIRALEIYGKSLYVGGYQTGILKYSITNNMVESIYIDPINNKILTIESIKNELWVGLFSGSYYKINRELTEKINSVKCNADNRLCNGNADVFSIKERKSNVWLAAYDGIYTLKNNKLIEQIDLLKYISNPYISNSVSSLLSYNNDKIFASLNPGGLVEIQLYDSLFTKYSKGKTQKQNYNNEIYAIEQYNNKIYMGSYDGLKVIDNKQIISAVEFEKNDYSQNFQFRISSLKTIGKKLYIGAYSGLYFMEKIDNNNIISKINLDVQVTSLAVDVMNNLWIGTSKGKLYKLTPAMEIIQYDVISDLYDDYISELLLTDDAIYIGTMNNGIVKFSLETQTVDIINTTNSSLISNSILSMAYSNNKIWIGTRGGALSILENNQLNIVNYKFISKNVGNTVYSIQIDEFGTKWLSTNNGLIAISKEFGKEKHFTISSGILDKEYNHNASLFSDKFVYFGGAKGVTQIDTHNSHKRSENLATIHLSKITIFNPEKNNIEKIYGPEINEVNINYGSVLNLFLTTSLLSPANLLSFEYKLVGGAYDGGWTELREGSRTLILDYLSAGSYLLSVRAKNLNNDNLSSKDINIYVSPPIWLSAYAILGYVFISILLILYMVKIYIKIKVSNEKNLSFEIELENKKKNIATLSHDLRTPLNSIVMLSDPHLNVDEEKVNTIHSSAMLLRSLISNALDQSLIEIGQEIEIKTSKVNIQKILSSIIIILQSYYDEKNVQVISNIQTCSSTSFYSDKTRIEQLCINILTNAIKHAPNNSSIYLDVELIENNLIIKIKDFGSGIPIDEQQSIFKAFYKAKDNKKNGQGLGLYISQQIVNRLNGSISINSDFKLGTEFILSIPNSSEIKSISEPVDVNLNIENINMIMLDDDPFNRIAFSAICEQANINVTCIATINELMKINDVFDLYILDLNLDDNDMDGIELANMLQDKGILAPKILLTADVRASERIVNSAICDMLVKPVTHDELISVVNKNISSST